MLNGFLSTLARLIADIYRLYRLKVVVLLLITIAVGLMDGIGMALLLPLLALVGVGSPKDNYLADHVANVSTLLGLDPNLETVLVLILMLFVIQGGLVIAQGRLIASVEASYVSHWRVALLERLLGASWPYFEKNRTGKLVHLIITEAERLGSAFFLVIQLLAVLVVAAAYVVVSVLVSWEYTLGMLLALLILSALMFRFSSKGSYRVGRDYSSHVGELQATITEFIDGAKLIKATASEPYVLETVLPLHLAISKSYFGAVVIPYVLRAVMELGAIVLFCILIYFGVRIFRFEPAVLLVLLAIFFRLVPKLYNASYNIQSLLTYMPSLHRIDAALTEIDGMQESGSVFTVENCYTYCPEIEVRGITVSHDSHDVLSGVSFSIPAKSTVGIVGSSGAGKSTLIDSLLGLIRPRLGRITYDGISLAELNLRKVRASIGYVGQETVLFHGTIKDIICNGRPLAEEAVIVAAKKAHAHTFIADLPMGYDTLIGPQGMQLSGGQKQRLSLARALAGNPVILILDEPTSSLDSVSEYEIVSAIRELQGKITVVVVSHRMATVRDADKIVIVDNGKIVGEGQWDELQGQPDLKAYLSEPVRQSC